MNSFKKHLPFYSLLLFLLPSCNTDFDLTAPYREYPVVYGLLNASDTVQYLRINKSFLGDADANEMAQVHDSIYYPDILDVTLEEYDPDQNFVRTFVLQRSAEIPKDAGLFANSPNEIYKTVWPERIVASSHYKLVIHNRQTDSVYTSASPVVDSIYIFNPSPDVLQKIDWTGPFPVRVQWTPAADGYLYEFTLRFHYSEQNVLDPTDIAEKYIDWKFPAIEQTSVASNMMLEIEGQRFYEFVAASLQQNFNVKRFAGKLDFMFGIGGKEYYTYMLVNKPPTGVNQNIPQYSNINGGLGLFSSRIFQAIKNKSMNDLSIDSLVHGSLTNHLGFQ